MIVRDDYDNEHLLDTILNTPHQFLSYTENHFWKKNPGQEENGFR